MQLMPVTGDLFLRIGEKLSVPRSSTRFFVGPVVFQRVPFDYFVLVDVFFSLLKDKLPYCNKQVVRYIVVLLNKRMNKRM